MAGGGRRDRAGGDAVEADAPDDRRRRAERRARADRRGPDRRHRERRRVQRRHRAERRTPPPVRGARRISRPPQHDARTDRGAATRTALVDAALDVVTRDRVLPGMTQVARMTGIEPRSVHYHFPTHHDLVVAATAAQQRRSRQWLRPGDPAVPVEDRADHILRSRRALQRALGLLHLAVATHPAGQGLDEPVLVEHRARLRDQLAETFAAELAGAAGYGDVLLDALDAAAGWPGWWPPAPGDTRARILVVLGFAVTRPGGGPAR